MFEWIEHVVFAVVVTLVISMISRRGTSHLLKVIVLALKELPGVQALIAYVLRGEVTSFVQSTSLATDKSKTVPTVVLPKKGIPHDELRSQMVAMQKKEANVADGNIFAYIYTLNDEHFKLQQEAYDLFSEKSGVSLEHDALVHEYLHGFLHENALNPMVFPSLRKMETEIVSMTAAMLNGSAEAVGFLTSGGTESNLMAVKTYRDRAMKLKPGIKTPNIVAPVTVHPTIDKAAHYFGLEVIHTPMMSDFSADVRAMEAAITSETVMLCASAPQFCHGVMDPIEDISALAVRKGLPLHVDGCFGGFMLPWVEKLGYPVPPYDFRCKGVTSISADVHKYGYGVKGSSVIVYRNSEIRKDQIYAYAEWPGGLYGSPSMAGTRPGGNIAASWVSMMALGEDGYVDRARILMEATVKMREAVRNIEGLKIMGDPVMTCFSVGSNDPEINIQALADVMDSKGWKMERNQLPDCIHLSILPHHIPVVDKFIRDIKESVKEAKGNKALAKKGTAAVYGMMASIPDRAIVSDFLVEFFSEVYKCK